MSEKADLMPIEKTVEISRKKGLTMTDFASERIEKQKDRIKTVEQELALGTSRGNALSHQELSSRRGGLKAMKDDLVKMENALCRHHVEQIKMKIESRGGQLSDDRKTKLGELSHSALDKLANQIAALQTSTEQINLVVSSIADFEQAQRDLESKKWDDIDSSPAKVEM